MKAIVPSAVALFRRYSGVETELAAATTQLKERQIIERTKAFVMATRKMNEPQRFPRNVGVVTGLVGATGGAGGFYLAASLGAAKAGAGVSLSLSRAPTSSFQVSRCHN